MSKNRCLLGSRSYPEGYKWVPSKSCVLPFNFAGFSIWWSKTKLLSDFIIWHGKFETNLMSPCNSLTRLSVYIRNTSERLGCNLKELDQEYLRDHNAQTFLHLLTLPSLWSATLYLKKRAIFTSLKRVNQNQMARSMSTMFQEHGLWWALKYRMSERKKYEWMNSKPHERLGIIFSLYVLENKS